MLMGKSYIFLTLKPPDHETKKVGLLKLIALAALTFLIGMSSFSNATLFNPIAALSSGRNVDVYTQYPTPDGGQGRGMPSKPFRPLMEVFLCAYVTYNLSPVTQKIVAFEIEHGEWVFILTSVTNSSGVAWVKFTIPWPDTDPSARVLGIWNVTATVNIADVIIEDKLWFYATLIDLNCDGKVDIKDIATVAIAFGSFPGHPRWNPTADLNSDAKIDMMDIATVAINFGKTYL